MPAKPTSLIGKKFVRLTVISYAGPPYAKWECLCDCGKMVIVRGASLRMGATKSCGCFAVDHGKTINLIHGNAKVGGWTSTYISWNSMNDRCSFSSSNRRHKNYKDYAGKGIKVCLRWRDFRNFLKDMGERPPGKILGRKDVRRDYKPSNCQWATRSEQNRNRGYCLK